MFSLLPTLVGPRQPSPGLVAHPPSPWWSVAQQPYRVRAQGGKGAVQVGDTNTHQMCGWHSYTEENRHSTWRRSFIRTLRLARCHRLVAVGTFIFMICSPPVMTFALMSFIATSQSFFLLSGTKYVWFVRGKTYKCVCVYITVHILYEKDFWYACHKVLKLHRPNMKWSEACVNTSVSSIGVSVKGWRSQIERGCQHWIYLQQYFVGHLLQLWEWIHAMYDQTCKCSI